MTLGQLDDVRQSAWAYIIRYDARHPGEVMPMIPRKARNVNVEYIFPTLYTLFEGSADATVKPCLVVVVNVNDWEKAVGHA